MESLKQIAVENAKGAAPDAKITYEEYRIVNGVKLLMMKLEGSINGLKFIYIGYYFSNEKGTIQLITYTGTNIVQQYIPEIESFLNGFVVIDE